MSQTVHIVVAHGYGVFGDPYVRIEKVFSKEDDATVWIMQQPKDDSYNSGKYYPDYYDIETREIESAEG
jgi:hypothetical protein